MLKILLALTIIQYGTSELDRRLVDWYLSPSCTQAQRASIESELLKKSFPQKFINLLRKRAK